MDIVSWKVNSVRSSDYLKIADIGYKTADLIWVNILNVINQLINRLYPGDFVFSYKN
jgi:hypothetical protein